jgi:hypothetical protein
MGNRVRDAALFALATGLGWSIAWMDFRPHWDDSGITALTLVLSAGVLGVLEPRGPWRWGLGVGIWIPLGMIASQVMTHHVTPRTFSYLAILLFPMAGVYAGAGLRRLAAAGQGAV